MPKARKERSKDLIEKDKMKPFQILSKIINILFTILLIIAVIVIFSLTLQKILYKDEIPKIFNLTMLQVQSGSMSGTFETGDIILVKDIRKESNLKIGDIVTYKTGESLTTHRIIDITKVNGRLEYTTKGDSNPTKDLERIKFEDMYGVYVCKMVTLGKLLNFMQKPIGMAVIIAFPIAIIALLILQDKKREEKKNKRREKRLRLEFENERKMKGM